MAHSNRARSSGITYNHRSQDFIPIACHYNDCTLLTKNGELIQTIQIHGTFSQSIGDDLSNLRDIIRSSLQNNITSSDFAFWIHTVRRKANLDDESPNDNELSSMIHREWRNKNFWHDKFVNTLYISIVHSRLNVKITNLQSLIHSFSTMEVERKHDQFLEDAAKRLHNTVDSVLSALESFGAKRLGLYESNSMYYSEQLFLYSRIINLSEHPVLLPIADISDSLSQNHYAVGNNQIEVVYGNAKKFTAILSIKEYHELPENALDQLLKLSVEFIATEIFYIIPQTEAIKELSYFDYILGVSKDSTLRKCTHLDQMMSQNTPNTFCNQQISISLICNSISQLNEDLAKASKELSKLGVVHVQEDINLEQAFWAQLPGNFTFIRRASPNILKNTAALASLHNFPTGNIKNPWGKAVTLMRTKQGTPHFVNFHNNEGNGNTIVFGGTQSGKTVILNFLLSEAMKFKPQIIYISAKYRASKIFIETLGGLLCQEDMDLESNTNKIIAFDAEPLGKDAKYILVLKILHYLCNVTSKHPKILAIDGMEDILNDSRFAENIKESLSLIAKNNTILLGSINLQEYSELYMDIQFKDIFSTIGCQIILPDEYKYKMNLTELLNMSDAEISELRSFSPLSRLLIIKQDGRSVALELSLGGKPGILKILSCSERDVALYDEIMKSSSSNFAVNLHNALASNEL